MAVGDILYKATLVISVRAPDLKGAISKLEGTAVEMVVPGSPARNEATAHESFNIVEIQKIEKYSG